MKRKPSANVPTSGMGSDQTRKPSTESPSTTPLKQLTRRIGEEMIENLNQASFKEAARYGLEGGRAWPYENLYLHRVAKPETLRAIQALDLRSQSIADAWAQISPDQVRKLEAEGLLLQRVSLQADAEVEAIADARIAGFKFDVPDSELLEMRGVDRDLHLYP